MTNNEQCPCGSQTMYSKCCEALHNGIQQATSPEALMRSRYSAYAKKRYDYVYATYAQQRQAELSISSLADSDDGTQWCKLEVLHTSTNGDDGKVEFCAYYQHNKMFHKLHEHSEFVREDSKWRYTSGNISENSGPIKLSRNEQCLCGSGKKYKRCCG